MPRTAPSADGTPIAHEILGDGPPLVLVAGIFCTRDTLRPLADALADRFRVAVYDRRGRGDSGGQGPVPADAVAREVQDLGAVVDALGGEAAVYGHSSGAGVALQAAAAGLPISRLVLHEPPYGPDDDASVAEVRKMADEIVAALAEGRPGDAIARFMVDMGLPPEVLEGMTADPAMLAVAPTMPYDLMVMGDLDAGGAIPVDLVRSVTTPSLVVVGGASPDFFRDTADRLVDLLPDARRAELDGQDHGAPAEVVAPVVAGFLASA